MRPYRSCHERAAGLVPDWAGEGLQPRRACRQLPARRGKHRLPLPVHVPTKADKVYRTGGNLTQPGAAIGTHTWEDFLSGRA